MAIEGLLGQLLGGTLAGTGNQNQADDPRKGALEDLLNRFLGGASQQGEQGQPKAPARPSHDQGDPGFGGDAIARLLQQAQPQQQAQARPAGVPAGSGFGGDVMPTGASSTIGRSPFGGPPPAPAAPPTTAEPKSFLGDLNDKLKKFGSENSGMLMGMASGLAGAPSFAHGMSRGFGNAIPGMEADEKRAQLRASRPEIYKALVGMNVPPQIAVAALHNNELLKSVLEKYGSKPEFKNFGQLYGDVDPATAKFNPQGVIPEFKNVGPGETGGYVTPALPQQQNAPRPGAPAQGSAFEGLPGWGKGERPMDMTAPGNMTTPTVPGATPVRTQTIGGGSWSPIASGPEKPPSFGVIGHDRNGNPIHGFIDPNTRTTSAPVNAPSEPQGGGDPSLTGDEFLRSLNDAGRANQVKAIADGRMSPPGGMSLKSPQVQGLMRDVAQYEPGFDLTTWTARNKTRADYSSGKMGQNISSFNTVIDHMSTLDKAAKDLGNTWSPAYNSVANLVVNQRGDPRVKSFETAKIAVVDELTRAFRGTGGNVHDLLQWEATINAANSPLQLKAAISQATKLLEGRIEAVGDQYSRGMGKTTSGVDLLSPKAKAGIQRLLGGERGERDARPAPGSGATPSRAEVEAEMRRRGILQ